MDSIESYMLHSSFPFLDETHTSVNNNDSSSLKHKVWTLCLVAFQR